MKVLQGTPASSDCSFGYNINVLEWLRGST